MMQWQIFALLVLTVLASLWWADYSQLHLLGLHKRRANAITIVGLFIIALFAVFVVLPILQRYAYF